MSEASDLGPPMGGRNPAIQSRKRRETSKPGSRAAILSTGIKWGLKELLDCETLIGCSLFLPAICVTGLFGVVLVFDHETPALIRDSRICKPGSAQFDSLFFLPSRRLAFEQRANAVGQSLVLQNKEQSTSRVLGMAACFRPCWIQHTLLVLIAENDEWLLGIDRHADFGVVATGFK
jgi:hypothetical protein